MENSMKKTLSQLIKQDKKILEKTCKGFKDRSTLEEELIQLFSNKEIQKEIKDKCVATVKAGFDLGKNFKIEIIMSNDKIMEDMKAQTLDLLDSLIKNVAKEMVKKGVKK